MRKRNTKTSKKLTARRFNPVKAKLESLSECFDQLRHGLPTKQAEYIEGRPDYALLRQKLLYHDYSACCGY